MSNHSEHDNHAEKNMPPINADNRSDANDGIERPLGYYSSQAQASRDVHLTGETPTDEAAGGPGFYSPEQQASRNTIQSDNAAVGGTGLASDESDEALGHAIQKDMSTGDATNGDVNEITDQTIATRVQGVPSKY